MNSFFGYQYPSLIIYNYGVLSNPFYPNQTNLFQNINQIYCPESRHQSQQQKTSFSCNFLKTNNQISKNHDTILQNQNQSLITKLSKSKENNETIAKQKKMMITKVIGKKNISGKYLNKNTQSNVSNQVFSYLFSKNKSEGSVRKYLQHQNQYSIDKVSSFYSYMKIVKRCVKKYFNKKQLLKLCKFDQNHPAYTQIEKSSFRFQTLNIKLFAKLMRLLIFHFLNYESVITIIHSKKIDKETQQVHLQRRRQIKRFLIQSLKQQ